MFLDLQTSKSEDIAKIEPFIIQGHDPRMLKASNSRSWGSKTLNSKQHSGTIRFEIPPRFGGLHSPTFKLWGHPNSKFLAFRGMPAGFEKLWIRGYWIKKLKFEGFNILGVMPQDVKSFESDVLGFTKLEFETFNILGLCHWMVKTWFSKPPRFGGLDWQTFKLGVIPNRSF